MFHYHYTILSTMKFIVLFVMVMCSNIIVSAQSINWGNSKNVPKVDSIAKKILEPVKYTVTYQYKYANDADYPDEKKEGLTILQIGNRYNRFWDYNEFRSDSIFDKASKENLSMAEVTGSILYLMKKIKFSESILIDTETNTESIQRTAGLRTKKYQYEEACPDLEWQLAEGDTIISGYHCNKATTKLFGRDYTAWYSPDVNLPYGPYKFNGLPGLIFKVTDSQDLFDFTLNGLIRENEYVPLYYWTRKDIIKSDRKTIRQIYKNYCADPARALLSDGNIQISEDTRARVKPRPYNPIELE